MSVKEITNYMDDKTFIDKKFISNGHYRYYRCSTSLFIVKCLLEFLQTNCLDLFNDKEYKRLYNEFYKYLIKMIDSVYEQDVDLLEDIEDIFSVIAFKENQ